MKIFFKLLIGLYLTTSGTFAHAVGPCTQAVGSALIAAFAGTMGPLAFTQVKKLRKELEENAVKLTPSKLRLLTKALTSYERKSDSYGFIFLTSGGYSAISAIMCAISIDQAHAATIIAQPQEAYRDDKNFQDLVDAIGFDEALQAMHKIQDGEERSNIATTIMSKLTPPPITPSNEDDFLNKASEEALK